MDAGQGGEEGMQCISIHYKNRNYFIVTEMPVYFLYGLILKLRLS